MSSSTGVTIQLTEDFVLLPNDSARLRRETRRRREQESRSRSRGRGPGPVSALRGSGNVTPLAAGSSTPAASTSRQVTPRGRSTERAAEPPIEEEDQPPPTAFIRGLLTLTLNKPSRIRKITLRFKGMGRTDWPEGIGPRRIEITEDILLYSKYYPVFSATASAPGLRRSNSVETLDMHDERQSRHDQHFGSGRSAPRASSVAPARDFSMDRANSGAYIGSRDAADQAYWRDPPPSFSETQASPPLSRLTSLAEPLTNGTRPSVSRQPSAVGQQVMDTQVSSPMPTPANEEAAFDLPPQANGSSSAPVPGTARSSFEAPSAAREPTPPARPSYQTAASAQRPAPTKKDNAAQARFSLTSLLKNRDRSESRHRDESPGVSAGRSRSRGRQVNLKAIRDALTSTADTTRSPADSDDEDEGSQHNWREFKAGRYVWPIQIPVPVTLPPSLSAMFGGVQYTLKAYVIRVGALTPNLTTETRVELVSSPGQDDTEETDTIVIERLWEFQMRYLITLSGKAFPVGGTIPVSIRMNPMSKVKLYRITASIEEKLSYFAHGRRIARHEAIKRFPLCKVEHAIEEGQPAPPLLPVFSDDTSALLGSPLASWMINATANEDHAPRLLDPIGPWELETNLPIPNCASRIHFSVKHPACNIEATHMFKLVLRVERGDREFLDAKGNPKKFDIVIECPIILLSCRNATNILPPYSSAGASATPIARSETCGCPASVSQDALARQQHFARLVAGAESPSGEVPPAYTSESSSSPARSTSQASPSPSRGGMRSPLGETAPRGRRSSISSRISRSISRPP